MRAQHTAHTELQNVIYMADIYICVERLEGWGKICGRTCSFAKLGSRVGKFQQLI